MATQVIRFGVRSIDTNGGVAGGAINAGAPENAIGPTWVGNGAGQQFQQLLALLDADGDTATAARDAQGRVVFGFAADAAFNLSDIAPVARASSLAVDDTGADPVLVAGHGRTGTGTVGDLTGEVRFLSGGFSLANRSDDLVSARFLDAGDALDFAAIGGRILEVATFQVLTREPGPGTVVLDVDGATVANPDRTAGGFATDGLVTLSGIASGDTVRVDFAQQALAVNGAVRQIDPTFWAAVAAAGRDNLTIGSRHDDPGGFAVRNLVLATAAPPPVDQPVVALDDAAATEEDAPLLVAVADLLANDSLPDGPGSPAFGLAGGTTARGGTVTLLDGAVLYAPRADFSGADSFSYTANDADGDQAAAAVTVTVRPVNDAPVAADDALADVAEGSPEFAVPADLLFANDADGDGDPLAVAEVGEAVGGTVRLVDGEVRFAPAARFNGEAGFAYTAADGQGGTAGATAQFTVLAVNDLPEARDDLAGTGEDAPVTLAVLGNDDPDGDPLAVVAVAGEDAASGPVTLASGATVTLGAGGALAYDPNGAFERLAAGEAATERFAYAVADGQGGSAEALVEVSVTGVNDAPVFTTGDAQAAAAEAEEGAAEENTATYTAAGSLAFADPDLADACTVTVSPREAGFRGGLTATVAPAEGGGLIDWSFGVADADLDGLAAGEVLTQVYDLTLADGRGGTASRTVTVTLTGAADGPGPVTDADPAPDRVLEGAVAGTPVGIDADAEGRGVTFALADAAGGRFAVDAATGVVTVANGRLLDFEAAASHGITVRATDAFGLSDEQAFTLRVADRAEEFRVNGTTVPAQFVDGAGGGGAVAPLTDGGYLVAWTSVGQDDSGSGVYARRYAADGSAGLGEARVNGTTAGDQTYGDAAGLADGGYVVTWTSAAQDGSGGGVYAQRYAADGRALGSEFQVNTTLAGDQRYSDAAALDDGGYLVSWTASGQDGSGDGVYAQRYAADGSALGGEFQVNATTAGSQIFSDAAALADGGLLLTWTSFGQDSSGWGIYARRYAADGTPLGDEFQVNATATGNQIFSDAAALADGGSLVTWTSSAQDGSAEGVFAQRYAADGSAVAGEFRVNATTTGSQTFSDAAALDDGGFLVSWTSSGQDGSGEGVYARRYAADGSLVGGEVRLNDTTAGLQSTSHVATLADGKLVAAWWGNGPGDDFGVFAKRYEADMLLA